MARQIHLIVQNPYYVDHVALCGSIQDEMPTSPALPRDVQRPKVGENFITGDAAKHVRPRFERGERFNERDPVNVKLLLAESVFCIFQDAGEILFSLITKANPPARFCQMASGTEAT